jgi:8-oxo-dGTP pyrophosphatase MutT (NUDIX family)
MSATFEKVTAFVVSPSGAGHDLLLFEHPSAGIQIPAGSVEPGEAARDAALREAREETGLADLAIRQELGHVDTPLTDDRRLILTTTTVYARPTVRSFDWARLDRGLWVRCERRAEGFVQVTYAEWDQLERPTYISYQITGWVPEAALASVERRHFFLLTAAGATAERWPVVDGVHRFILFWAPIAALPAIAPTQSAWLAMLPAALRH